MAIARRYEIYLPLTYNDGRRIEQSKNDQTIGELLVQFSGITTMRTEVNTSLLGFWMEKGQTYEDQIVTYAVYSLDINAADAFIRSYKSKLKRRFRQLEVLMVAQLVELF